MPAELNDRDYELLSAYLDGMLAEDERAALETRLNAEPMLRGELRALRQTVALLNGLPTLKAPRNFTLTPEMVGQSPTRISEPTRPISTRRPETISFPLMTLLSAAASVMLILAGVLFIYNDTGDEAAVERERSIIGMTTNQTLDQAETSIARAPTIQATLLNTPAEAAITEATEEAPQADTMLAPVEEAVEEDTEVMMATAPVAADMPPPAPGDEAAAGMAVAPSPTAPPVEMQSGAADQAPAVAQAEAEEETIEEAEDDTFDSADASIEEERAEVGEIPPEPAQIPDEDAVEVITEDDTGLPGTTIGVILIVSGLLTGFFAGIYLLRQRRGN